MHKEKCGFFPKLALSIFICVGGGWLTGQLTQQGVKEGYPQLIKPPGTPPNLVFPVVWMLLYIGMAVALTLLWTSKTTRKTSAYLLFAAQLCLNLIWPWLFFFWHRPGLALIDIIFLWGALFLTYRHLQKHTKWGSFLLLPYLAWVTYALYLNAGIWIIN